MDRPLVLTLTSRQRDMFDDVQLIVNDVENDLELANVIISSIIGDPPPHKYTHAEDIIAILEDDLRVMFRNAGIYDIARSMTITSIERAPRSNALSIYLRIGL